MSDEEFGAPNMPTPKPFMKVSAANVQ